jgi:hypothetical protein
MHPTQRKEAGEWLKDATRENRKRKDKLENDHGDHKSTYQTAAEGNQTAS